MALDREEMNRRRQQRDLQRKKQLEQQRKLQKRLIIAAVILVICGIAIFVISGSTGTGTPEETDSLQVTTEATEPTRAQREPITTIHIRAAGDLNVTDSVIASGTVTAGYNFTEPFKDVLPLLSEADLTLLNFEGILCGEPYGTESTSAPLQLMQSLSAAGVDVIQMANSCSVNNGLIGLSTTLNAVRSAGLEPLGAFATPEEFQRSKGYTICDVQGVRVALVAFTKGVGNMGLPAGNEDCVNLLYTDYATTYREVDSDGITKILKSVASENPDVTVAMLHWGSEHNDTISETQDKIVALMQKNGVDVILGTHPHRVQEISYDENKGQLVAYSLGDFFGDGTQGGTNYSIILDVEITKDNDTGDTKVTGFSYTPIYTLKEDECDGQRRVVRIRETMAAYDINYVDKVTPAAYESMKNALERIEDRVVGKYK